jgi:thiosulfate/3-mercaptopyruvate sulfurtransferase
MAAYADLISVSELKVLSDSSVCRIVDCRFNLMQVDKGHEEYLAGHIPGAVYAHLDEDLASPVTATSGRHPLPDVATLVKSIENWGIGQDTQVVVYDHANGAIAARLWWLLRWLGHDKVAVLNGGIVAWKEAGEALTTEIADYPRSSFAGRADVSMVATTEEIVAAISSGEPLGLVDARDAARFGGETEPIDTVAGHIPGAMNWPFQNGVRADGRWLSAGELASSWQELLPGALDEPLIAMCGSGVTACHLVISARLAGLAEPRLYVGSWSEWIRDDRRPVSTPE